MQRDWGRTTGSAVAGLLIVLLFLAAGARAGNLLPPGNLQLRNDVQLLADGGYLAAPVETWPLPWAAIAADLEAADTNTMSPAQYGAWSRLTMALRLERVGGVRARAAVDARSGDPALRWYQHAPRAEQTASLGITNGVNGAVSYDLHVTAVHDADDGREVFRPDSSYLSLKAGNWLINTGWLNRWWGPAWSGSVILGTNARPAPGIAVSRARVTPFDLPVLEWLGPWRLTLFADRLEDDRAIPHPYLLGARFSFRPVDNLTIGFSRTVQWGGAGIAQDWVHFRDMLLGNSYRGTGVPGSSLGGFDIRWHFGLAGQPFALYLQEAGEDTSKAYHLPRKFAGLIGLETTGAIGAQGGMYRLFIEYADTTTGFLGLNSNEKGIYNVAYENHQYRNGYRYLGRTLGYPTDNDSRLLSIGAVVTDVQGHTLSLLLRGGELNRDDTNVSPPGGNPVAPRRTDLWDLEFAWSTPLPWAMGRLTLAAGTTRLAPVDADAWYGNRIRLGWTYGF